MRLWTVHPIEVWHVLKQQGYYHGEEKYIDYPEIFLESYNWMKEQLAKKTGVTKDYYPVWAWAKKPDMREGIYRIKGCKSVLIEFEIYEEEVLLSDYELWHYVLNYWYIPNSIEEGDYFNEKLKVEGIYGQQPLPEPYHNQVVNSWQKIFDLDWYADGIRTKDNDKYIQAVFWELKLNQVINVKEFMFK